ncbi:acetamidase/formamidase family protein [Paenibacillus sp. FSL K6-0108]|uniref:acetamidase/formamidase family protein n=1 Tax=Paenibacillus sp. FSL K6-0108 TaxID=2921417 RepID=UPI003254136D
MVVHKIVLSQESIIGSFTKEVTPILSVSSGDSIRFETLDAGWGTGRSNSERRKPFSRKEKIDGGHALVGPIYIEGAKKGMTLEIEFNDIIPGQYGFTSG